VSVVTNINVKNSWIYANRFNHELFSKLRQALDENHIEKGNICLDYPIPDRLKNDPHFILREPIFYNSWEGEMLCKMNGINSEKIHVYRKERTKYCDKIFLYKDGKLIREK